MTTSSAIVIVPILVVALLIGAGLIQRRRAQLAEMELNGVMGGSRASDQVRMRSAYQSHLPTGPSTAGHIGRGGGGGVGGGGGRRYGTQTAGIVHPDTDEHQLQQLPQYNVDGLPKYEQVVSAVEQPPHRPAATATTTAHSAAGVVPPPIDGGTRNSSIATTAVDHHVHPTDTPTPASRGVIDDDDVGDTRRPISITAPQPAHLTSSTSGTIPGRS